MKNPTRRLLEGLLKGAERIRCKCGEHYSIEPDADFNCPCCGARIRGALNEHETNTGE